MILKVVFTLVVFILCVIIYRFFRYKEHSLVAIIVAGIISTIIGNILIPSNIGLYDIFCYVK